MARDHDLKGANGQGVAGAKLRLGEEWGGAQAIEFLAEKQNNCRLCRCCNIRENSIGTTDFVLENVHKAWHGSQGNGQRAFRGTS
jgi:hypothetical protein